MTFAELRLIEPLLRAITEEGYSVPTPVQEQAIPHVLAGRDLLGIAQTGTGKTAAFAVPILQRLASSPPAPGRRPIRVLVITPTRELATQIGDSFRAYGRHLPLRHSVIFGGVGQGPQREALSRGIDVLVATPGRLLDLMAQRHVHLDRVETFVLDEADRMLDMGFLPDVRRIISALPKRRQTLFFSATMPSDAQGLADRILVDAARVTVAPPATTVEKVSQSVYFVEKNDKQLLLEHLLADSTITRALVFTRTKHLANRVATRLERAGFGADAIHANKSQRQRERALGGFKAGGTRVLVATDIAARGIDVDEISHVVNFDLPNVPESYVHRIGRTARAGAAGCAISFCDREERAFLRGIEREIRMAIPVVEDHPYGRARPPSPVGPTRAPAPSPEAIPFGAAVGDPTHPVHARAHAQRAAQHAPRPLVGRVGRPGHGRPSSGGHHGSGGGRGTSGHGGGGRSGGHRGSSGHHGGGQRGR